MGNGNYTTKKQMQLIVKRLLKLSSASKLDDLSSDQLKSTLKTIHDNHIELADMMSNETNQTVTPTKGMSA